MEFINGKQNVYVLLIIIILQCLCLPISHAKPALALAKLIHEAKQHNPEIKAARDKWLAANHVIPQARSLPDPKIGIGSPMYIEPMRLQMIIASQEIPFPGKLVARGEIASESAKRAQAEYQATCFAVIAKLKRLFYDLYFSNKSIEILEKTKVLLKEMEKSAQVNYSVGNVPQQDIFRAQTEITRLDMRLVILKQECESLKADINQLLNRALDISIQTPAKLDVTHADKNLAWLNERLQHSAPKLKAHEHGVLQSRRTVKLSQMNYFPDIELTGGKLHNTSINTNGYMATLKATIPLYFMGKQNNNLRESLALFNAEMEDLHTTYQLLLFQVKNAYLIEERSARLIELIDGTIIPLAKMTFQSSLANYGVGKVDFLTILNNLLTLQENEIELHNEIATHEKAVTMIEEVIGKYI